MYIIESFMGSRRLKVRQKCPLQDNIHRNLDSPIIQLKKDLLALT